MRREAGLLSTAKINDAIIRGAAETDAVDVVAVASRDEAKARAYAAERGLARPTARTRRCWATTSWTPSTSRCRTACTTSGRYALAAGKHVLCEKPYTRTPAEVDEAFDAAEAAGLVLMEAFMYRHHPQTKEIERLVREGAVGRLRAVHSVFSFPLTDLANIRASAELAGGALMDVGCYCVSGARIVAGDPVSVFAEQVVVDNGIDMATYGTMRFWDEVVAQFEASFLAPERQSLEIVGSDGVLRAGRRGGSTGAANSSRAGRRAQGDARRGGQLVHPSARELRGRGGPRGTGAARSRRRDGAGARDRRALPLRRVGRVRLALTRGRGAGQGHGLLERQAATPGEQRLQLERLGDLRAHPPRPSRLLGLRRAPEGPELRLERAGEHAGALEVVTCRSDVRRDPDRIRRSLAVPEPLCRVQGRVQVAARLPDLSDGRFEAREVQVRDRDPVVVADLLLERCVATAAARALSNSPRPSYALARFASITPTPCRSAVVPSCSSDASYSGTAARRSPSAALQAPSSPSARAISRGSPSCSTRGSTVVQSSRARWKSPAANAITPASPSVRACSAGGTSPDRSTASSRRWRPSSMYPRTRQK